MRKIDIFLISIVAIYLSLVLPTFNKEHVMDFGNTSDIISSACNIAMATAAIIALLKAKDWLKDKKANLAFEESVIFLAKFDELKIHLDIFHTKLTIAYKGVRDRELYTSNKEQADKLQFLIAAFIRRMNSSERVGFNIKTNIQEQLRIQLPAYIKLVYEILERKYTSPELTYALMRTNPINNKLNSLNKTHKQIEKTSDLLKTSMDDIFEYN